MRREELTELHYIVHFDNIISIIQKGILSNSLSIRFPHKSVASEIVQEKRKAKILPQGKSLHDYVNLYICGRNPMLYRLSFSCGYHEICVLSISPEVIEQPGVVISERNASSDSARFAHAPDGLLMVDKDKVFARYWNQPDPIEKYEHVSIKCAEVLVLEKVDPKYINKAYVSCQESKTLLDKKLHDAGLSINVVVDTYLFFK